MERCAQSISRDLRTLAFFRYVSRCVNWLQRFVAEMVRPCTKIHSKVVITLKILNEVPYGARRRTIHPWIALLILNTVVSSDILQIQKLRAHCVGKIRALKSVHDRDNERLTARNNERWKQAVSFL